VKHFGLSEAGVQTIRRAHTSSRSRLCTASTRSGGVSRKTRPCRRSGPSLDKRGELRV
jgi:hypothetical protein